MASLGRNTWGLLLALAVMTGGGAEAQITSTVSGIVTDASGAVLPGATVTATSPNLRRESVTVTDIDGRFRLIGLPAGAYQLVVELSGFGIGRAAFRLGLNESIDVNIGLGIAALEEAVTVTATPLVEVRSSGLGKSIQPEAIDGMPLKGRQFLDLIQLVPGVAPRPAASGRCQ